MAKSSEYQSFCHLINLNKLDKSLTQLFDRISNSGASFRRDRLIPLIVHLRLTESIPPEYVPTIRTFLKRLRPFQDQFFVRFATTMDWAMESDNYDVFYTRPELSPLYNDMTFIVKAMDKDHIHLTVSLPCTTKQHQIVADLSKRMTREVSAFECNDDESLELVMLEFYKNSELKNHLRYFEGNLHVIMILSADTNSFYTIPIVGLDMGDAQRRFIASQRQLDFLSTQHDMLIPDVMSCRSIMASLAGEIQLAIELEPNRYANSSEIYNLAELLFGYYVDQCDERNIPAVSSHELLLFHVGEDAYENPDVDLYNLKIKNMIR